MVWNALLALTIGIQGQGSTPPELPDIKAGRESAAEVEKETKPTQNPEMQARVERIGKALAEIANKNPVRVTYGDPVLHVFNYQFKVVTDPKHPDEVNAFALPGGYVYVYEGLLKFAESDDEVAGVLAHEIAHASLRHGMTLQKQAGKLEWVNIVALLAALYGRGNGQAIITGAQLGAQAAVSGWSQDAEEAADFAGFQYMNLSNYDAGGMVTFMERLSRKNMGDRLIDWGIYRTHPPTPRRINKLNSYLSEAGLVLKRSKVTKSYRASYSLENSRATLRFGNRVLGSFAGPDAESRAKVATANLNQFFDKVPNPYEVSLRGTKFMYAGRELFELTDNDAEQGEAPEVYRGKVLAAIKSSLFGLSYSVWSTGQG